MQYHKLILLTTLVCITILLPILKLNAHNPGQSQQFVQWKSQHNIVYKSQLEEHYRHFIFMKNVKQIQQHNQNEQDYKLGMNQFAGLTKQQFASLYLLEYPIEINQVSIKKSQKLVNINIDWSQAGAVLPVQNSGSMCSPSYVVSSVGALSSLRKIKDGLLKKVSQQQIIDCSGPYGNSGCNSGSTVNVFKYVVDHGISDDSQYPYVGQSQACKKQYGTFKISGLIEIQTCQDLETSLLKQPISVLVDASNWMFYRSGIFTNCTANNFNMFVLLIGASDTFWKVKNQWGTSWGQQGYMRLQMGNCCGICSKASAPLK